MALKGGALAGAWIGGLLAGVILLALLLFLFRMFMQVVQIFFFPNHGCILKLDG